MNEQDERYSKLRRQKINVMLNDEERRIITEKAIKYGYGDCLAEYIRAACIYENIYIEDIEGKNEICNYISDFIQTLREILYEQKVILKNVLISPQAVENISNQNNQIIEMIDILSSLIVAILSVNTEKKIQQRMSLIEKYSPDEKFLRRVIKKNESIYLVRPSNLQVPNTKSKYIVYLKNSYVDFDLDNLNMNIFEQQVNAFRDVAMKKKAMLSFYREDNKLECSIVIGYDDLESARRCASEIKSNVYYYNDNEEYEWTGDNYSSDS